MGGDGGGGNFSFAQNIFVGGWLCRLQKLSIFVGSCVQAGLPPARENDFEPPNKTIFLGVKFCWRILISSKYLLVSIQN